MGCTAVLLASALALAPAEAPPERPTQRAWSQRAVLAAWAGPSLTTLPKTAGILGGDLTWRIGVLGLQLSGWHAFAVRTPIASGVRLQAALSGGGLRFVVAPRVGPIELPMSIGVELGALVGRGIGSVRPQAVRSLWAALAIGIGLAWPAQSRFALAVRADALVGLVRPGLHLWQGDTAISVFRAPPAGFRVLAGPMVRLP